MRRLVLMRLTLATVLAAVALGTVALSAAPQISSNDAYRVKIMLDQAYTVVKDHYYDRSYHGLDWEARHREYLDKVKHAASLNAGVTLVAAFLDGLKDSHTYFAPPARPYRVDYGYRLAVVGDRVFVVRVRPGTDAVGKVAPGDEVLSVEGGPVSRATFPTMEYVLSTLSPRPATRLAVRTPAGATREVTVTATVTPGRRQLDLTGPDADQDLNELVRQQEDAERLVRQVYVERGDVMLWKMPTFMVASEEIDHLVDLARQHTGLVLDLRGNPGGYIESLRRLVSDMFDHDVVIATRVTRQGRAPLVARTRGDRAFMGTLVVLVDGASASAAELFARVVQIEHRGVVLGDRSSGSVMEAQPYGFEQGGTAVIAYGFSVTEADLVMGDGRSLEGTGVVPDEPLLPAPGDLASGADPVLAAAAARVGLALDPATAGRLFPFEWQ